MDAPAFCTLNLIYRLICFARVLPGVSFWRGG